MDNKFITKLFISPKSLTIRELREYIEDTIDRIKEEVKLKTIYINVYSGSKYVDIKIDMSFYARSLDNRFTNFILYFHKRKRYMTNEEKQIYSDYVKKFTKIYNKYISFAIKNDKYTRLYAQRKDEYIEVAQKLTILYNNIKELDDELYHLKNELKNVYYDAIENLKPIKSNIHRRIINYGVMPK